MATYNYTIATAFPDGEVVIKKWTQEILDDVTIVKALHGCCITDDGLTARVVFDQTLSTAEETALDSIVAAHSALQDHKDRKNRSIDKRTEELIAEGFTYNSKTFSLSIKAQSKLSQAYDRRSTLTYPIKFNTLDDSAVESLADSSAVSAFFDAATDKVRSHIDSGTAIKDDVRAASTIAAVDAITDTR